jgi:PPOX class probable F420-dependent enzyme
MDIDEARTFLRDHRHSLLHTFRSDGRPQLSPITHAVDDEGRVLVSSREPAYKVRNLQRDARATVIALSDDFFGPWVQIDGTATIVHLPDAMELLVDYYRRAAGEHSDWDDYRRAMERDRRVLIRIDIERAGPNRAG